MENTIATAFAGPNIIATGLLLDVALAVKAATTGQSVLVFDDATGKVIDLDLRGGPNDIAARLGQGEPKPAARGRPKLGVVAREVTLLPRHWDWLSSQPGGASQALRRLVDKARAGDAGQTDRKARHETAYRFMSAIAGNLAGFEEASRALFADDGRRFDQHATGWPTDIRDHARRLAGFSA